MRVCTCAYGSDQPSRSVACHVGVYPDTESEPDRGAMGIRPARTLDVAVLPGVDDFLAQMESHGASSMVAGRVRLLCGRPSQ